jgi:hypothetical protein
MNKMSVLYVQEFELLGKRGRIFKGLSDEVRPENAWVFTDPTTVAYRKLDGAACAIIEGKMYARIMVGQGKKKRNKKIEKPIDAIPAQPEPDPITGQHPHWVPTEGKPQYKWFNHTMDKFGPYEDGTYELCGSKIGGDPEATGEKAFAISHTDPHLLLELPSELNKTTLREMIEGNPYEGIIFKNANGDYCKLRRFDFMLKGFNKIVNESL